MTNSTAVRWWPTGGIKPRIVAAGVSAPATQLDAGPWSLFKSYQGMRGGEVVGAGPCQWFDTVDGGAGLVRRSGGPPVRCLVPYCG